MTEPYERLRECSYESWKINRTHHWMPAFGDRAMAAINLSSIDEAMGVSTPSQPTIHSTLAVDSDTPRSSRRWTIRTKSADSAKVLFMHLHNFMALRTRLRSVLSRSCRRRSTTGPGHENLLSWTL